MAGSSCSWLPTRPLAQTCVVCGRKPPRFVFFVLSGSTCNGIQLAIDRLLAFALPTHTWWVPTFCWTVSYAVSVSFRFVSHAALVFGPHRDPPLVALGKTYCTYLSTILASTAVNLALVAGLGVAHEMALIPTAAFSVCWSYVALSYTWRDLGDGEGKTQRRRHFYRAVDDEHGLSLSEESTPTLCAKRGHAGVSTLSSAAWFAPGVHEWAGLSQPRETRAQSAQSDRSDFSLPRGLSAPPLRPPPPEGLRRERSSSADFEELELLGTLDTGGPSTSFADRLSAASSPVPPVPRLLQEGSINLMEEREPELIGTADTPPKPPSGSSYPHSIVGAIVGGDGDGEPSEPSPCSPRPVAIPRL